MKNRIAVIMIAVAAVSITAPAQYRAIDALGVMTVEGRPFMTDAGLYNSYYMGGSPLGRFEMESASRMDVELGYRHFSLDNESGNYLSGQKVRMGEPGRAYFELFYGPDMLSRRNLNTAGLSANAAIQRFGLALAAQSNGGFFRGGLSSEGYIGGQKWNAGDSSRAFMGFEKIRLDMGSSPIPFLRVGFHIDFTAHLDTLKVPRPSNGGDNTERIFQMNLPEFGGNIDFGSEDFPVRSNLSMSNAWSRFVYTSKGVSGVPNASISGAGNELAIVNDSFQLFWLTNARLPLMDENYVIKPGLLIGFTNNTGNFHIPHEKNDPFKIGNAADSLKYDLGGFHFGLGAGAELLKYADLYTEYSLASMSLKLGSANKYNIAFTNSRMLHNIKFGVSTPLHKYVDMPVEVTPRTAYFISGSTSIAGPHHSNLDPLNTGRRKTMTYLYEPQNFLEGYTETSGFTIGVDASALENNMLSLSYWMTFLTQKTDGVSKGGMELGLSLGLSL